MATGGRDVSFIQSLYLSALLFVFVAVWATTSAAVIAARVIVGAPLGGGTGRE